MADANKVIEKLSLMLSATQRELAITMAELEETQEKLMAAQVELADKEET